MSHPRIDEVLSLRSRDDVASDDLNVGVVCLDVLDHVDLEDGVSLRGVEDDDVDAGLVEQADPLLVGVLGGDGGAHQQLVVLVLGRVGVLPRLFQIGARDEGHQLV